MYLTGGYYDNDATESSFCVLKIDPNLMYTEMMPMIKARTYFAPVLVQDRYILAIGGHSNASLTGINDRQGNLNVLIP